jgi:hypothetical protein
MAERRMFAKTIIDSDAFLDMSMSAQALYFHLAMRADDEGFVNNPKKIQRMVGAADDDLKILRAKRFIIAFESGIVVIKHWKIHNYLQKDRVKPTVYQAERALISLKENRSYTEKGEADTICIQNVSKMDSQYSIDETSIDEISIVKKPTKQTKHQYGLYKNVLLSDDDYQKLKAEFPSDYATRIDRLSEGIESKGYKYKNHLATIRVWARNEKENPKSTGKRVSFQNYDQGAETPYIPSVDVLAEARAGT